MDVIKPIAITDTTLTASNVPETDYPEWDGTLHSYVTGESVMVTGVHKTYQAIVDIAAAGSNLSPEIDALETVPKWVETGVTNRWKMLTAAGGEQTSRSGNITIRITPAAIVNSLALLDLVADSVRITLTDPAEGVVYDKLSDLTNNDGVDNWYSYFFQEISLISDFVVTDLPSFKDAYIDIVITSLGVAKCGITVIGNSQYLGGTQYGASVGISDYSVKKIDDFGRSTVLQRSFVKTMQADLFMHASTTDNVHKLLAGLRATPALWIGADQYTSTFIYGYYKDFSVVIAYHSLSTCSLEIEGLI